jgi:cytochrome P450
VHTLARRTTQDVELHGVTIPAESSIFLLVGAANRDPAKFPDPERLDINRQPTRTLAFGYGIHYCLGAALARLESQVVFETLLRRLPNLQLAVETPEFRPNYSLRGLLSLPVTM